MQRPETVIFVTEILGYIVAAASVVSSTLLVFIVYKYSPREMGAYKWYIAFNAISCGTFDIFYGAFHPEVLFPAPIVLAGGILKNTVVSDFATRSGTVFLVAALGCLVGSTLAMLVFRFCQSAQGKVFLGLFDPDHFHLVVVLLAVPSTALYVFSVNVFLETSRDVVLRRVASSFPSMALQLEHRTVVGLKSMDDGWMRSAGCFVLFCLATVALVVAYCVYACYTSLRRNASSFSPKTLRLFRSLVYSLALDMTIGGFVGVVPVTVVLICAFLLRSEWASAAIQICLCVASFYPLASHVVWLTYITPYRRAFLRMFAFRRHRRTQSQSPLFLASTPSEIQV